ncbi:MAG: L-seryl-tRNA(Sec) selenium transferase [Acidobacteria bacterium]|nr:MAG: L-seryl-tRNA(Sec) selenium transferase [Acidobacteriota bacterium]
MKTQTELFRELPAIDELLREPEISQLSAEEGQSATADACRVVLARLRDEISAGHLDAERLRLALTGIHAAIRDELSRSLGYSLKAVINATGVVLHTNLGRAPLARSAIEHIRETADAYSNLEFDIESGDRGKRDVHVDRLFRKLLSREHAAAELTKRAGASVPSEFAEGGGTGVLARAAASVISTIVVNNNAAAVLLALNTLAEGGEVIVSRGELVEIGGSFRIPDVMTKSGATLREVGTTNRTRIADYERAINERTKLLLRVHRSNFEITGFTEQPDVRELGALAAKHKLPLMEDLGSGALFDLRTIGINNEPSVHDSLRVGVHVVTYSGDKLLGGPQAGLISGREDLVQKMRSNSLFRALRVDKLIYAALEATLLAYAKRDYEAVPALRMMQLSKAEITKRADIVTSRINSPKIRAELVDGESLIGGGSAPSAVLPTTLIALTSREMSANDLAARLRRSYPPIIARVEEGRVLLDLRTVFPAQDEVLRQVLAQVTA